MTSKSSVSIVYFFTGFSLVLAWSSHAAACTCYEQWRSSHASHVLSLLARPVSFWHALSSAWAFANSGLSVIPFADVAAWRSHIHFVSVPSWRISPRCTWWVLQHWCDLLVLVFVVQWLNQVMWLFIRCSSHLCAFSWLQCCLNPPQLSRPFFPLVYGCALGACRSAGVSCTWFLFHPSHRGGAGAWWRNCGQGKGVMRPAFFASHVSANVTLIWFYFFFPGHFEWLCTSGTTRCVRFEGGAWRRRTSLHAKQGCCLNAVFSLKWFVYKHQRHSNRLQLQMIIINRPNLYLSAFSHKFFQPFKTGVGLILKSKLKSQIHRLMICEARHRRGRMQTINLRFQLWLEN